MAAHFVTHLPAAFVGKPAQRLRYKPRRLTGLRRLPFVAGARTCTAAPYWHVPATGGYFGGYATGEAMALALLKWMRAAPAGEAMHALLDIAASLMVRYEQEGGHAMQRRLPEGWSDAFASLRGQYTGFFNTLSGWLAASARSLGASLDGVTERALVRHANGGLGFDHAGYMASLPDDGA